MKLLAVVGELHVLDDIDISVEGANIVAVGVDILDLITRCMLMIT
jgi:hypothetical protein